jgi:predicted nucleic acid-binding protein
MTFTGIPSATTIFLDANTIIYHFSNDKKYGPACTQLIKRIELRDLSGFTSAHALADVTHRLMTLEAINQKGWPQTGVAARLRKHHDVIPTLSVYRQAVARIPLLGIQVLPLTHPEVETATQLSHQYELLTGDALVVAVMRRHGLSNLASADTDFDRVPGITRYAPL